VLPNSEILVPPFLFFFSAAFVAVVRLSRLAALPVASVTRDRIQWFLGAAAAAGKWGRGQIKANDAARIVRLV